MDDKLARYFFVEVARTFHFLEVEYRFASPHLEIDTEINFAFVTFLGQHLAIEFILDEREADITCKIALVIDHKKTAHYARDEHGKLVRDGLYNFLLRRGIRERLFHNVGALGLYDKIPIKLEDYAKMLRRHGADILRDSPMDLA